MINLNNYYLILNSTNNMNVNLIWTSTNQNIILECDEGYNKFLKKFLYKNLYFGNIIICFINKN